jgi:hypothetical protein
MLEEILRLANLGAELERRMKVCLDAGSPFYLSGSIAEEDSLYHLFAGVRQHVAALADAPAIVKANNDVAQSSVQRENDHAL